MSFQEQLKYPPTFKILREVALPQWWCEEFGEILFLEMHLLSWWNFHSKSLMDKDSLVGIQQSEKHLFKKIYEN